MPGAPRRADLSICDRSAMSTLSLPVVEDQAFYRKFETDLRSDAVITTLQINIGLRCNLAWAARRR